MKARDSRTKMVPILNQVLQQESFNRCSLVSIAGLFAKTIMKSYLNECSLWYSKFGMKSQFSFYKLSLKNDYKAIL